MLPGATVLLLLAGLLGGATGFVARASLLAGQAGGSANDTPKQVADRSAKAGGRSDAPPARGPSAPPDQKGWVEKTTLKLPAGQTPGSVALSPAGVVVAGTHDGAVRLWDAKGRELPPLEKPSARAIASLAFCPTNAGVLA